MKNHDLITVLAVLTALLLLIPAVLCVFAFALPAQYAETFLGELPCKMERLRSAEGPRIILVGGSSVPFSIKSELIEGSFPEYSVVDFGLYAELGTPMMLDWLEEELREGDLVIISPEQDSQALSAYFSGDAVWQAVDGAFPLLKGLSPDRYERLLAAFPVFAGKKCRYFLNGSPQPDDIYARASFNRYGDIASSLRDANIMAGGYDPNQIISFSTDVISEDFLSLLNEFAAFCQEKGVEVYYRFPPMNQAALEDASEKSVDSYYDFLRQQLDFPILGDPHRSILESGWFYDTNFHLNDSGATVFTKYLIEDLKILWKDTSPAEIAIPPMPAPAAPGPIDGDSSCADCFTYTLAEDGWIISGLTEKGRTAQALILPVSLEGQSVVGIAADALTEAAALREVTIQENIGTLYDGMFAGCSRLEKVILTGDSPSSYTVGDGLMEGAEFFICVPSSVLDAYRRHYSWQQYSAYLIAQ